MKITRSNKLINDPSDEAPLSLWKIIANYNNYETNSSNAFEFSGKILISSDLKNIKVYLQNPKAQKSRIKMIEDRMREVFSMSNREINELIKSLDKPLF